MPETIRKFIIGLGINQNEITVPIDILYAENRKLLNEVVKGYGFEQTEKGKIKLVRKEALLFGFETCYKTRRYQDILSVTNKLDRAIIENSSELNDFVEAAGIMIKGME